MNYDYKVLNTDPTLAFVKRAALYVAILSLTIALALIVLFVLFERYLMLIMPGAMILFFVIVCFLVGRSPSYFSYHFTDKMIEIAANGRQIASFFIKDIIVEKNADNSDFFKKNIVKYTFSSNRIIVKTATNNNNSGAQPMLCAIGEKYYVLALDDYALSIIRRTQDEI